jgi:hypothetical protein
MKTKTMALALLALVAGAAAQTAADCDRSVKNCNQCRRVLGGPGGAFWGGEIGPLTSSTADLLQTRPQR